jgi:hypothetical protein
MKAYFLILLLTGASIPLHAQLIQNPLAYDVQQRKLVAGPDLPKGYSEWKVDIAHTGNPIILLGGVAGHDPDEDNNVVRIEDNPNQYYFDVYIPANGGTYYLDSSAVDIDIAQCYVGYVSEVNKYGLVTTEQMVGMDPKYPEAKHGVIQDRIYAYTVEGNHLKQTLLSKDYIDGKNKIYMKYLSPSKRTKVQLQPVTP